jgi:FkbM family methyltransferase
MMRRLLRNALTVSRQPALAAEYASWLIQKLLRASDPIRTICGVRIGNFNGFSEYHWAAQEVSARELAFLRRHDFGEGAIIDVGANLGLFSLVVRERFHDRRIIAFEPVPSTFAALLANAARNSATNMECHPLAVSDRDGTARFVVLENARANSSLETGASPQGGDTIEIECVTLDRFVSEAGIERIALLKVDVEGFEISVFRGAADVLSRVRPRVVYFEICPAIAQGAGFPPDEAAVFLEKQGYALHRLLDGGLLQRVRPHEVGEVVLDNWVGIDTK